MKNLMLLFVFLAASSIYAQESNIKSINLTIYNNNLGVVKEVREFDLQKGQSTIQVSNVPSEIIPTTVHIDFDGSLIEQNYKYDLVSMGIVLNKYIDKDIALVTKDQLIEGTLLSVADPSLVLRRKDGGLIMIPDYNDYRISVPNLPSGLITRPTLEWLLNTKKSGKQDIGISYQTNGIDWHAEYVAVVSEDDKYLDINAWISLDNNSGVNFENANLKLMAGDIKIARNYMAKELRSIAGANFDLANDALSVVSEKEFADMHLYDYPRKVNIKNRESKQLSLFESSKIKFDKKYKFTTWNLSNLENQDVAIFYEFLNSKDNNLGMPFPKGTLRMNKKDGNSVMLIGETNIDHTPKDEKIKINTGNAFDLKVNAVLINQIQLSDRMYEYELEYTFKNRKEKDNVEIEFEQNLWGTVEILESNMDIKKEAAGKLKAIVPVSAGSEKSLKFKVRIKN